MSYRTEQALALVGTPYEEINCWQLVQRCFRMRDVELPDNPWESIGMWTEVDRSTLQEGDVLVFTTKYKLTTHVGVAIDGYGHFLHSVEGHGVVRDSIEHDRWSRRLAGVMRLRA